MTSAVSIAGRKPYQREPELAEVEPLVTGGPVTLIAVPAEVDLELYAGDDFTFTITVNNPDGTAANLTGFTAMAQIRAAASLSSPVLASFTPSIAGNVISLHLPSTGSTGLPPTCVYDAQMTDPSSVVTTLVAGTVTVAPQVTQ
jgi:hypothetical protein